MLIAGLLALVAGPASAQVIRGVVRDASSGRPVALAYAALMVEGRRMVVATLAADDGSFTLRAPAPGSYFLYVTRLSYKPVVEGVFDLGEGGMMDVQVGLVPAPIAVDSLAVEVEGGERSLRDAGYYRRKALGLGRFLEREQIETAAPDKLTDAFRNIPRIDISLPRPALARPTGVLNPEVLVRTAGGLCSPTLYVNGGMVARGGDRGAVAPVRPDDFAGPSEVEAVEIYAGPSQIPTDYMAAGGCGVILIWTRMR